MARATPNPNISLLGGRSVHDRQDSRYIEYRRQWMENPATFTLRPFPIHLDIEPTNRCNLKCTFCDKLPYLRADQFGDMNVGLFKRILDEGCENDLCSIKLSYRGEPLCHPQLVEMVGYAKKKNILDVYFNTNAMLLTEDTSNRLIDAGLDRISISVEGTDPELFEKARKGASYKKILDNVDRLIELREQRMVDYPLIRVQTVALPWINLEEYRRFWSEHSDETAAIDYKEADEVRRNEALWNPDWACPQLWQRMTIEWDGTIMPCNNDDYRKLSPGRVTELSVKECWTAPNVDEARRLHREGKSNLVRACNGCPWRTTQLLKEADKNA